MTPLYGILKSELTADPLARGYTGLTDVDAANSLNTPDRTIRRIVPTWEVKQHAIENGYWAAVTIAAEGGIGIPNEVRGLAISARDWIDDASGKIQTLDFDRASTQAMVAGMVAATIMNQGDADSLSALANQSISRATEIGWPEITEHDIAAVRSGE